MGLSENNERALLRRSPEFDEKPLSLLGSIAHNSRGEYAASVKVAVGAVCREPLSAR
jgi:hypothetical protein